MRRALVTAGLLTALCAGAHAPPFDALPAAVAKSKSKDDGDGGPALRFFEKQYEKMAKKFAGTLFGVADRARRSNLFQFARQELTRVLDFDPDHKQARELLGFVRKGKSWELDPAAAAKMPELNQKNAKESQKTFDKKVEKWQEAHDKADALLAAQYARIGDACKDKGYDEQAQKAWERALLINPNDPGARKGLGHVQVGKFWMTQAKLDAVKAAVGGEWTADGGEYAKGLGVALSGMESAHFRVYDDKDRATLEASVKMLEALYIYTLADVGIDPTTDLLGGKKIDLVVVSTDAAWHKWVDEFSNSADKEWTRESTTSRSYLLMRGGVRRVETAEVVDTRDPLLHHAAHFLGELLWSSKRHAWIDEGLAYHYTMRLQDTTRTSCLSRPPADEYARVAGAGQTPDWELSEMWREYLRRMVKGKSDTELRKLMGTDLSALTLADGVKSWAVVTYFMEKRRDEFIELLKRLRAEPDADPVAVVQEVFGEGVEALDKAWREYAIRAY